ncbi:MAG: hypothetical protein ACKO1K_10015, partial [Burkholderiales bacterium]
MPRRRTQVLPTIQSTARRVQYSQPTVDESSKRKAAQRAPQSSKGRNRLKRLKAVSATQRAPVTVP